MSEQQKEQQLLETVDRIIAEGTYQPAWSSLMQAKTPDWFKQKRFGIFIHWGVYSVPANSNEWYGPSAMMRSTVSRSCCSFCCSDIVYVLFSCSRWGETLI